MKYHAAGSASTAWDIYWFEKNLQGDIVAVYDKNGTKLVSYKYDAWGRSYTYSHNGTDEIAEGNPFRYRGYYYDADLELYYLGTRYYDAFSGRFISPDRSSVITATPMGLTDKNLYAYCDNNPVMRVDGDGEFWNWLVGLVVGAIGGAISASLEGKTGKQFWASVAGGAVSGTISGIGADLLVFSGGTAAPIYYGMISGGIGSAVGTLVEQAISGEGMNVEEIIVDGAFGAAFGALFGSMETPHKSLMEDAKSRAGKKALKKGITVKTAIQKSLRRETNKLKTGTPFVEEGIKSFTSWFFQTWLENTVCRNRSA